MWQSAGQNIGFQIADGEFRMVWSGLKIIGLLIY